MNEDDIQHDSFEEPTSKQDKPKVIIVQRNGQLIGLTADRDIEHIVINMNTKNAPDEMLTRFTGDGYDYQAVVYVLEHSHVSKDEAEHLIQQAHEQAKIMTH